MQKFNKYSLYLIITSALYILVQFLFSWNMGVSGKTLIFWLISLIILGANVFFIFRLNTNKTDQLLKIYNSYLLISTFVFYLSYCLKASLITKSPQNIETPLLLELLLLVTLLFNSYQIFIYSREIKKAEKKNQKKKKSHLMEIFSWADALLSAVIFVLMINMFLIQIYSIPSESMFPVFFVKDRPVVDKITRGPSLPFTRFRIPPLQSIKRGDIITFRNPKYAKTVESELKHLFSQFLYMITFTTVNIDRYDEKGNEKADPLVKRVIALPGEQIQMINDVIYYRKDLNEEFQILEEEIYSETDLYKLPKSSLNKLKRLPINSAYRALFDKMDIQIANVDKDNLISEINNFKGVAERSRKALLTGSLRTLKANLQGQYDRLLPNELSVKLSYFPFQKVENSSADQLYLMFNLEDKDLWDKSWKYLSSGFDYENKNGVESAASNLDLYYKSLMAHSITIYLQYKDLEFTKADFNATLMEDKINTIEQNIFNFKRYLSFYDFRNLPPFPKDSLIEKDQYFAMGDNRYNSLDLRHRLKKADRLIVEGNNHSFVYKSHLGPMTINEKWIEGFVTFRIYPLNRIGIP